MSGSLRDQHRRPGARGRLVLVAAGVWACGLPTRADDDRAMQEAPAQVQGQQQVSRVSRIDLGAQFEGAVGQFLQVAGSPAGDRPPHAAGGAASPSTAMLVSLREIGESRLAMIDAACGLSPDQFRRLRLAVESDIRCLADTVDAARAKYRGRIIEFEHRDQAAHLRMHEFHEDVQRLARLRRSLLGSGSLLAKALPTTLDGNQIVRLAADTDARRGRRWQVIVASFLNGIDASLGLDQRQYDDLEGLLLERRPPLRLDVPAAGGNLHHAEQLVALSTLAAVDAGRLQATLSDRQWKTLAQWREQGRNVQAKAESLGILEQGE